jgi:hypothetical protein
MAKLKTIILYVDNKFVTQRKVGAKTTMKEIIDRWKRMYALHKYDYKIYITLTSKMNEK